MVGNYALKSGEQGKNRGVSHFLFAPNKQTPRLFNGFVKENRIVEGCALPGFDE